MKLPNGEILNYPLGEIATTKAKPCHVYTLLKSMLLEFDKHIRAIVNKANIMLGMIRWGFTCLDKEIFLNLYPVLMRPLLEYCVQVWSPHNQMHIDLIEGVQKRATRLVPGTKNMNYDQRLAYINDLPKLEERRVRGDVIETYKILKIRDNQSP